MRKTRSATRECEIKCEILNSAFENNLKRILVSNDFLLEGEQLESDYVTDTEDFLCKKNGLLLRFRGVRKSRKSDILLTLKSKLSTKNGFKDAMELQYLFSDINVDIFQSINKILKNKIGKVLPQDIHLFKDLKELRDYLTTVGFPELRVFIEKKRTTYRKGRNLVTLDLFPKNIGYYLEIETPTPQELEKMIDLLQLPKEKLITDDYGGIVIEKQKNLPEKERRIAIFS